MFCADAVAAGACRIAGVQVIPVGIWGSTIRNEHRHLRAIDGLADVLKAVKIPVPGGRWSIDR
jgi:hypothetical protein